MFLYKGTKEIKIIAGPCSAETEKQVLTAACELQKTGIETFRAGIWKPRSRAHQFEGVGEIGLKWLQKVQSEFGMKVATEVGNVKQVELCLKYGINVLWIGARTTVNPFLMQDIANALKGSSIPVMIKNPVCPDKELWIGAVERLMDQGVTDISLIHRGFSAIDSSPYRNAPYFNLGMEMHKYFPRLPIICDPSHICGKRELLAGISSEALSLGMDGLMIESHCFPDKAWSDARQQLTPSDLSAMLKELNIYYSSPKNLKSKQLVTIYTDSTSNYNNL